LCFFVELILCVGDGLILYYVCLIIIF